jgi:hypothetical protein
LREAAAETKIGRRPMVRSIAVVALVFLVLALAGAPARGQDSRPAGVDLEREVLEIESLVKARRFADAWKRGSALRPALEGAGVPAGLRARGDKAITAAGIEVAGPAAAFRGRVAFRERDVVEATYDFRVAGWEPDFELVNLLPTAKFVDREAPLVEGTVALCHGAVWTEPFTVEFAGRAVNPKDFGPVLVDPDEAAAERFLTGFHNNAYFGIKYDADRAVTQGHILLLAGRGAVSRARSRPTQLLGRTVEPAIARGAEVTSSLTLAGTKTGRRIEFRTATGPTSFATLGFDLAATQDFPRVRAGILVRESSFEVARVVLRGRLDPAWAREEVARLRESGAAGR